MDQRTDRPMTMAVVISTYNNPEWLEKTLWGYLCQERMADELIIADDGSTEATAALLRRYRDRLPIRHVWHEDKGFRKTKILNEALKAATADYLIFTDQDCIPRRDFIAMHERLARRGRFLSGGYFKLPMAVSKAITCEDVACGRAFSYSWLKEQGVHWSFKCTKLMGWTWMNLLTPTRATWNGMNSSAWREDILRVNGFDERMQYGGEDREMGERLVNLGLRGRQIRYSAIVLHLDHSRPYVNREALERNMEIRRQTRRWHAVTTAFGVKKPSMEG